MYSVSQAYLDKLYGTGKKRRVVSAFLDSVAFDENDIVANTLKYSMQAASNAEIHLGGVFLGQLWLTFTKSFADTITRGTWKGKTINLSIGLETGEAPQTHEPVYEYIPIGLFVIDEANHTANGVEITAYDTMIKFDEAMNISTTSGSLYSLLKYACNHCGVTLGMTKAEVEALPNGLEVFSVYPENDMETFRDLVSWVAATAGCFATINRSGELVLRGWSGTAVQTLGIDDRYAGGSWSDFRTFYTGLSVVNIADQTTSYYHTVPDNGLVMNLGSNPLLQYGLAETRERQREAVLTALSNFNYVPFKVSAFADPFFDLGDVINFNSGLAGTTSKCCVMRIDFSFAKGITLQGFGKNPSMIGAQSKTDKNLAGLSKQNQGNETKFEVYENADQIQHEETNARNYLLHLAQLTFACSKDTVVEVNTSVNAQWKIWNENAQAGTWETLKNQFMYVLDNSTTNPTLANCFDYAAYQEVYEHDENIPLAGAQRYDFYMPILNVKGGEVHTLDLYWKEIRAFYDVFQYINTNGLRITLKGQGLVIEKPWDGFIIVEDTITPVAIGGLATEQIADTEQITIIVPISLNLTDAIHPAEIGGVEIEEIADSTPQIMLARPKRNLTTIRSGNLVNIDETKNFTTI